MEELRPKPSAPERDFFDRLQSVARYLLAPYIFGVVLAVPVVIGYFGYGLAHASGDAAAQFLGILAVVAAVAIAAPLTLLLPGRGFTVRFLKSLGMLVMAVGIAGEMRVLWYAVLEPAVMTLRFNHAMNELAIEATHESPLYLGGQLAGVHVAVDVRVRSKLRLDRYGSHVLDAMQNPSITLSKVTRTGQAPFSYDHSRVLITKDGRPLESLPGLARSGATSVWPPEGATLPAGMYRVERDFWFWGLQLPSGDTMPCRGDQKFNAQFAPQMQTTQGIASRISLGSSLTLRDRLGYRSFRLDSEPLQFRYQHAAWLAALPRLPVDQCSDRAERKRLAEEAAAVARAEQLYEAGSLALREQDNPLYRDMCADDLEPLRRRLAKGTPRYGFSGKLWDCAISRPRPEVFALMIPLLYARTEDHDAYCSTLSDLHRSRRLDLLAIVAQQKLPLVCPGARAGDWRAGISPFDDHGNHVWEPPAEQTFQWLTLLRAQQIPICETTADGDNLLRTYITRESANTIELLLDAGCDVHVRPKRNPEPRFDEKAPYSAAVLWMLRRFEDGKGRDVMPPVETGRIAAISRRIGDVTTDEITEADPVTGRTFLDDHGGAVMRNPALMVYLLSRGVRLDAAAHNIPRSWYGPGYSPSNNNELIERPMLDQLSVAQLRQLIAPVDTLTHEPSAPMSEVQNFSPAGLGTYLCRRQVIDCPP